MVESVGAGVTSVVPGDHVGLRTSCIQLIRMLALSGLYLVPGLFNVLFGVRTLLVHLAQTLRVKFTSTYSL
jgi:hypothetical protein